MYTRVRVRRSTHFTDFSHVEERQNRPRWRTIPKSMGCKSLRLLRLISETMQIFPLHSAQFFLRTYQSLGRIVIHGSIDDALSLRREQHLTLSTFFLSSFLSFPPPSTYHLRLSAVLYTFKEVLLSVRREIRANFLIEPMGIATSIVQMLY